MIELYNGDCMELLPRIPDKSVNLILCDLPYGVTHNVFDVPLPFDALWAEYKRVLANKGVIALFGIEPFASKLRVSNLPMYKYDWIWYKHNVGGFLNAKKMPLRNTERICVFYNKGAVYNPIMRKGKMQRKGNGTNMNAGGNYGSAYAATHKYNDIYYPREILDFKMVSARKRFHPTEKPVPLLEYLIRTYTFEGDTVLDNCMGSGSTGVACVNTGRNFIGMELQRTFYAIAQEQIHDAETQKGAKDESGTTPKGKEASPAQGSSFPPNDGGRTQGSTC